MTTIKQFKEWLNKFPEETIINVAIQRESRGYESYGAVDFEDPDLKDPDLENYGKGWEFVDYRKNRFVKKESEAYGKCYLFLGEKV